MLKIIKDVENMGDYCDLFKDVNKDYYRGQINLYNDPIPLEEQNENIPYASNLIRLMYVSIKSFYSSIIMHIFVVILQEKEDA